MNTRAVTIATLVSLLCGLALAAPAAACPKQQQNAENSSPVVLAGDMESEAVEENLRPDEVSKEPGEAAEGAAEEDHSQHKQGGDMESEAVQKDLAPDTVPAGE